MESENGKRKKLQADVANFLSRGTSSTILGIDGIGSDVFLNETLELAHSNKNVHFVHVNCTELVERTPVYFYRSLLFQFIGFLRERDVEPKKIDELSTHLSETDLFILVNVIKQAISLSLDSTGIDPITMVITNLTKLIDLDTSFYSGLRSLRNEDKDRLSFLFRDTYKFVHSFTYENTGELFELIRSSITWIPLASGKTYIKNIEDNEEKFNCKLERADRERIFQLTHGHAGLAKYSVAYFSIEKSLDSMDLIQNDAIKVRLDRILNELVDSERDLLKRIANGEVIIANTLTESHLIDSELVLVGDKDQLQISIPLLSDYLKKMNGTKRKARVSESIQQLEGKGSVLVIEGDDVYLEGKRLETELTKKEFQVLDLLYQSSGKIVTRDDVAAAIWGDLQEEKFSDWAIDQTVSRLRKKIGDSGYSPKLIKTVRGRGFKLVE